MIRDLAALVLCAVAIVGVLAGTHRALRRLDPRPPALRHPVAAGWAALWLLPSRCALRAWLCVAVASLLAGGAAGAGAALWWLR